MSFVSSVFTWARTATKKSGKNTLAGGNSQLIKKHFEAGLPGKGPWTVTSGTFPGPGLIRGQGQSLILQHPGSKVSITSDFVLSASLFAGIGWHQCQVVWNVL